MPTIRGSARNDALNGTSRADTMYGLGGSDALYGRLGYDVLYGGLGNDVLWTGPGSDKAYGEAGHDQLYGETGADTLDGGTGHDLIYGGQGRDTIYGGDGNDVLGGGFQDHLRYDYQFDTIYGGNGNDTIYAQDDGADQLRGEAGDDTIYATGDDVIAGAGNDEVLLGTGKSLASHSLVSLGQGQDAVSIAMTAHNNGPCSVAIRDFTVEDRIYLQWEGYSSRGLFDIFDRNDDRKLDVADEAFDEAGFRLDVGVMGLSLTLPANPDGSMIIFQGVTAISADQWLMWGAAR
jgi:Ca2+-binding RTX toxin-like protein